MHIQHESWLKQHTLLIGRRGLFVAGDSDLGTYTRVMNAILQVVEEDNYLLPMGEGTAYELKGDKRLKTQIRIRVARRIADQLNDIARVQNKKNGGRRHSSWSNREGRYVNDGE